LIVPCGISDRGVTSLERTTGRRVPIAEVEEALATRFAETFDRDVVSHTIEERGSLILD